uniref:Uncharacterized protein n=1 Tax=Lepeophtheirus salmonis TaxID=72036 RepID=A0A0K2UPZ5_LEPSM
MTLERVLQISINVIQAVVCLQAHRLFRQQVQNIGEEKWFSQKSQTGTEIIRETAQANLLKSMRVHV